MIRKLTWLAATLIMLGGCSSHVSGARPSHSLSKDEIALLDCLEKQHLTGGDEHRAGELLKGVRLVAVHFLGQSDVPDELKESIRKGGGRFIGQSVMGEKQGRSVALAHRPLVVFNAGEQSSQVIPILNQVRNVGLQPFDVLMVYEPGQEVLAQTERVWADATQHVWETLMSLKSECPQLAKWDEKAKNETKLFSSRGKSLHLSDGIQSNGKRIGYRVTYTTPYWCCIFLYSGDETLQLHSDFDDRSSGPEKFQQHWMYPRLGRFVHWVVESGDGQFSQRINGIIEQALEPLREQEEQLGGAVVKNSPLRTF